MRAQTTTTKANAKAAPKRKQPTLATAKGLALADFPDALISDLAGDAELFDAISASSIVPLARVGVGALDVHPQAAYMANAEYAVSAYPTGSKTPVAFFARTTETDDSPDLSDLTATTLVVSTWLKLFEIRKLKTVFGYVLAPHAAYKMLHTAPNMLHLAMPRRQRASAQHLSDLYIGKDFRVYGLGDVAAKGPGTAPDLLVSTRWFWLLEGDYDADEEEEED